MPHLKTSSPPHTHRHATTLLLSRCPLRPGGRQLSAAPAEGGQPRSACGRRTSGTQSCGALSQNSWPWARRARCDFPRLPGSCRPGIAQSARRGASAPAAWWRPAPPPALLRFSAAPPSARLPPRSAAAAPQPRGRAASGAARAAARSRTAHPAARSPPPRRAPRRQRRVSAPRAVRCRRAPRLRAAPACPPGVRLAGAAPPGSWSRTKARAARASGPTTRRGQEPRGEA